ncbi:CBS domain-containing protein [Chamaesiphon minutus]|uniref:tRNA nucleotidyltransferase/poly(A) polymerase n=1 Tax=Chamaesiphon minutus (strain ATCC 27169 / PCC 6605) TaxID=1173020 RepID=K9ULX8_CHAP6|nr:CBS domain-containing protein [Chamaesiphon minutus]AFY96122.1 tRNA nucleotidyltransferase/poly(A) polymerase [Chamaesiphon minutus PCC 6605]
MDLILCHTTADFDTLGAAVGLARLLPGSRIVLTGGAHPTVRDFLALYRDEYPLLERRSVVPAAIRSVSLVDAQQRDRVGKAAEWLELPDLKEIVVYDHHLGQVSDIPATRAEIEPVGATTTLIVERLQRANIVLTIAEATVMALGIHVDTGSLTFEMSTPRDALALGWLMQHGADLAVVSEYVEPGLSPQLQSLLQVTLKEMQSASVGGKKIGWVRLATEQFVPGLSSLVSQIQNIDSELSVVVLAHEVLASDGDNRVTIIGRSQIPEVDLRVLFSSIGGGGHAGAASASLRAIDIKTTLDRLMAAILAAIPQPLTARDLMSAPIRTLRPDTTIAEAQRILLRYGHSGLPIVAAPPQEQLVGIISRRDLDIALHHGFSHAPVKGYMTNQVRTIAPDTTLPEIEALMVTYDIGRLPVLADGKLVGIVTRTDVLRSHQHHQMQSNATKPAPPDLAPLQGGAGGGFRQISPPSNLHQLQTQLVPQQWELLMKAAQFAQQWGWHLYLIGGAVRDLLLSETGSLLIKDIDLVVDGFHQAADVSAGVKLATALQEFYPAARLDVHGAFQTAALLWHDDPEFDSLGIDIATARTEFYPYPAANPEVEASSIRQDLYRRDFTINAMALRLTAATTPPLLDFFGGVGDLQNQLVRVLHPNSFIEDPTRIFRGVRFAIRLGFQLETQTADYIRYAISSGVYDRTAQANPKTPALQTRLKTELKYLLQAPYWRSALELLSDLGALHCIHSTLKLEPELVRQLELLERCLRRFDAPRQLYHSQPQLIHWQLRLETIIATLAPAFRQPVAKNLQLPEDTIERLANLDRSQTQILSSLPTFDRVSQVVQLLKQFDLPMLILIAVQCRDKTIRRQIWRYLIVWAHIQPPLNGNDLRRLGYKPGPQYRQILANLLAATLDGVVIDRASAEAFLQRDN